MSHTTAGAFAPPPARDASDPCATLEANLRAIEHASPRAARAIRQATPRPDLVFSDTPDNALAGEIDGRALCSRRHPLEEASRFADAIDLEKAGAVVVLGFAMGHHVRALARRARHVSAIVVFEPDVALLRAVLERVDHSAWIEAGRLVLITEGDNAATLSASVRGLEAALAVGIEFVEHPPSRSRLADTGARFAETFTRVFQSVRTHIITTMVQTDVTVRNELMNLDHYLRWPGVAELAGIAAGRPAIVVSAGPSLRRNIELLKAPGLRDRCVIVCVQTVLRQLLNEGIEPHFVTAIDYHEISRRFYEGLEASQVERVTLVAEARANPAILDAYPGPIRVPQDAFLTRTLAWEDRPDRGSMIPAATVAHLAYYLARHLGADPVILVGQDLAFTDGQYYARGAAIHDVWAPELNPFNTLEMMEWQRIMRARTTLHRAADHQGRPVYTDEQMATYLAQFERDFQSDTERGLTIIDATEGGVAKAHTSIMTLAEAIQRHAGAAPALAPIPTPAPSNDPAAFASARERLASVRADVRRIARASREARDLMRTMIRDQRDVAKTNRLIDRVNSIRDEVQRLHPAFELVMQLNQTGALKRFKADRAIKLADELDAFERQRRQIERDAMNLEWIGEYADLLDTYMEASDAAFDTGVKLTRDIPLQREDDERHASGASVTSKPSRRVIGAITLGAPDLDAGAREFLGRPVLAWTIDRLSRCRSLDTIAISTTQPQRVRAILGDAGAGRVQIIEGPAPDAQRARAIAAARAWADASWRAGLAGLTPWDEAFDPIATSAILERTGADAALIVGASWALVDPALTDRIIERHVESPQSAPLAFCQAPPGLAPAVLSRELVSDLAEGQRKALVFASIGGALGYIPTQPRHDPIARPACVQIDASLRATLARFIPDHPQTLTALEHALTGIDAGIDADAIAARWRRWSEQSMPASPREITLELTTARPARGDRFWFIDADTRRDPITLDAAERVLTSIADAFPDARLTLAGLGDPLEHERAFEIIDAAHAAGIGFLHVRTDLLCPAPTRERLVEAPIDVISVDALAHRATTYQAITGVDRYADVCTGIDELLRARRISGGMPQPWIVPRITRRDAVYEEIEVFFDKWTMLAGAAVIDQLPETRFGDRIEPLGKTRPVVERDARRRMTILCDGSVIADELDLAARRPVASLLRDDPREAWARLADRRAKAIHARDFDHHDLRTGW